MDGTAREKIRNTQTITQIVAEKVGLNPSHVAKVLKGTRKNDMVSQQYSRLEELVEQFRNEPIEA